MRIKREQLVPGLLILVIALNISCYKTENNIQSFEFGTSFGECIGYCIRTMNLEPGTVTYTKSGWSDSIPNVTCAESIDEETWTRVKEAVNTDEFFNLPLISGCPDCADGGAEWVEIVLDNGMHHKVTYEYNKEPGVIQTLVTQLRLLSTWQDSCGAY